MSPSLDRPGVLIRYDSEVRYIADFASVSIRPFGDRMALVLTAQDGRSSPIGLVREYVAEGQQILTDFLRALIDKELSVDLRRKLDPMPSEGDSGPTWIVLAIPKVAMISEPADVQAAVGKRLCEATVIDGLASLHFE